MSKWTPGPWTMETVRTSVGVCFKVGPFPWKNGKLNHACIYADYPGPQEHATAEANAKLIAAAPDLAEALGEAEARDESMHAYSDLECFVSDPETHDEFIAEYRRRTRQRAALAKARGES